MLCVNQVILELTESFYVNLGILFSSYAYASSTCPECPCCNSIQLYLKWTYDYRLGINCSQQLVPQSNWKETLWVVPMSCHEVPFVETNLIIRQLSWPWPWKHLSQETTSAIFKLVIYYYFHPIPYIYLLTWFCHPIEMKSASNHLHFYCVTKHQHKSILREKGYITVRAVVRDGVKEFLRYIGDGETSFNQWPLRGWTRWSKALGTKKPRSCLLVPSFSPATTGSQTPFLSPHCEFHF